MKSLQLEVSNVLWSFPRLPEKKNIGVNVNALPYVLSLGILREIRLKKNRLPKKVTAQKILF